MEKKENKKKEHPAKHVAISAMLVAIAMIFSYVEAIIPFNMGVYGAKIGLANLVIVAGFPYFGYVTLLGIQVVRIVLTSMLFGNVTMMMYSLAGGILSLTVMAFVSRIKGLSMVGVSVCGGVSHNVAQLVVAMWLVQNVYIGYYLPALLVTGVISGVIIGIVAEKCRRVFNGLKL